jgi:hypothetical protein
MVARLIGLGLSALLMAGAATTHAQAKDADTTYESPIIGSTPGATVGGVNSAGAPWKVRKGHATLEATGRLRVEVEGLLLLNNTTGRVVEVVASLVCGGSGGSVSPMATGTPVGLSAAGNAEMRDDLTLNGSCQAPVVLVRIFTPGTPPTPGTAGAFIALSGVSG